MSLSALLWSDVRAFGDRYDPWTLAFWLFLIKQTFFHGASSGVSWYRYGH